MFRGALPQTPPYKVTVVTICACMDPAGDGTHFCPPPKQIPGYAPIYTSYLIEKNNDRKTNSDNGTTLFG